MDDFENFLSNFNNLPEPSIAPQTNYNFIDDLLSEAHLGLPLQTPEPLNFPEFGPEPTIETPVDTNPYAPEPARHLATNLLQPRLAELPAGDPVQPGPSGLQATAPVQDQGNLRPLYIRPGAVVARTTIQSPRTSRASPSPHPSESQALNRKTLGKYRLKKENELPQALVCMSDFMTPTQGPYGTWSTLTSWP